jgi:hypothetical protein
MAAAPASVTEDRKLLSSPNLTPTTPTVEHANKKAPAMQGLWLAWRYQATSVAAAGWAAELVVDARPDQIDVLTAP